jgi:hypothetical protein
VFCGVERNSIEPGPAATRVSLTLNPSSAVLERPVDAGSARSTEL